MPKLNKQEIFFHPHVPKCGGTTFAAILKANFSFRCMAFDELLRRQYSSEELEKAVRSRKHYAICYTSHSLSLDLPYHSSEFLVHAIVYVRNPVDHFLSYYFYKKNKPYGYDEKLQDLDFQGYLEKCDAKGCFQEMKNRQTNFLNGNSEVLFSEEEGLKIEKLVKQNSILFFPLDRFDESLVLLEKIYPSYFKDCSYVPRNSSKKDIEITESQRQFLKGKLVNGLDFKIYNFACQQLEKIQAETFSPEEYKKQMEFFARRKKKKKFLSQIKPYVNKVLIKLGLDQV